MRRHLIEYVLKGVLLGLLVCAGLTAPERITDWQIVLWPAGGLVLGVLAGVGSKLIRGFRPGGHFRAFYHIVILEIPGFIYTGTIVGAAVAASLAAVNDDRHLLPICVVGGVVLGVGMSLLRGLRRARVREMVGLIAAVAVVAAVIGPTWHDPDLLSAGRQWTLWVSLMCGMIFFGVLVFAGAAGESEADAAVFCAGVALVLWFMRVEIGIPAFAVAVPFALYFLQLRWAIPRRRITREINRGESYARLGLYRPALEALRQATRLDPTSQPARKALWHIHRDLDATRLAADPELVKLVDPQLCLDRVAELLLVERPTEVQRAEAMHLLDLVAGQSRALLPQVTYWRAVAETHAGRLDDAAANLVRLLDQTAWPAGDPSRQAVLLPAWELALTLHPELNRRVGSVEITKPGGRMEAIAAVEQGLAVAPKDPEAWKLKRLLYHDVTEAEYDAGPVTAFDHAFVQQLGLALIGDPNRFIRGAEYLRIAARGLPHEAPSIYTQVAAAFEQAGDADEARRTLRLGKAAGLANGPQALPEAERNAFFALVRRLAEDAHARDDLNTALEDYQLYTQYERAGVETYRILADLYEKLGDALSALRTTEQALTYTAQDRDLLARRDRYYYSVTPDQLRAASEQFRQAINVRYCLAKARQIVEHRESDFDTLDWAVHLIELAEVVQPSGVAARVMLARAKLRRGERDEAVAILESVRSPKPETFATTDDEDAWFLANKLLGDLYLRELDRPDLAVECFTAFRASARSGADTLFKLGEAHERLGEAKRAARFYEQVTAFDEHPLAPEARAALYRVRET